ncbi:unnamed protein product [Danaus chrysippus]|uniref:(African queen) hypothetical protein n=1 Tax=Danaus chrysippus TaxID=151541 RepID=A0A8J2VRR5_9NEOP|nr:unnamed protein product [Danaus chrysippus]
MGGTEITSPLPYEFPSLKINAVEHSLNETLSNFKVSVIKKLCDTKEISALDSIRELTKSSTEISKNCSPNDYKETSPDKDIKDVNNDTVLEIEGTPTGRKSPIIQSKKGKHQQNIKDKIKCPDDWLTPERKSIKLSFPSQNQQKTGARLKQSRLSLVKTKNMNTIDLTCSPECIKNLNETEIQRDVKKDIFDSDTILPSPTSGVIKLPVYKTLSKESPNKMKRPQMSMKLDLEEAPSISNVGNSNDVEDSINILQNYPKSPTKKPLNENVNIVNKSVDGESRSSLVKPPTTANTAQNNQLYKVEPLFKEPSVRTKAEKRSLPGWSCDECREFFDELYKDDPVMLARKMNECSKHRGRNNPVRPNTPGGFWEPRWDVPDDTEEFNRRNNV